MKTIFNRSPASMVISVFTWPFHRLWKKTIGPVTPASSTMSCLTNTSGTIRLRRLSSTTFADHPMMIKACLKTLTSVGVPIRNIAYDEF